MPPNKNVAQVEDEYRYLAKGKDIITYLYILNEQDILVGVLDIKELFRSPEHLLLSDIMIENIIYLNPKSNLKEASDMFARYSFRAIPVVDEVTKKMYGVIPYRDVMKLKHRFLD